MIGVPKMLVPERRSGDGMEGGCRKTQRIKRFGTIASVDLSLR